VILLLCLLSASIVCMCHHTYLDFACLSEYCNEQCPLTTCLPLLTTHFAKLCVDLTLKCLILLLIDSKDIGMQVVQYFYSFIQYFRLKSKRGPGSLYPSFYRDKSWVPKKTNWLLADRKWT
jgi:hypothetical protein